MAFLWNMIPKSELGPGKKYTHYGRIHGWVPVYFGDLDSDAPRVAVQNGLPDFIEDVGRWLFIIGEAIVDLAFDRPGEGWRLEVLGEIPAPATPEP